jgi:hypothetical protein
MCAFWLPLLLLSMERAVSAEPAASGAALESRRLQKLVDAMRAQLAMPDEVTIALVASNPLMASVERIQGRRDAFQLSIDLEFLARLNDDELRAVLAHELGHVWIFTHHPYLQTEQLANQIALRLVGRETLAHVYEKVWPHATGDGKLARFPNEPTVPAATPRQ